MKMPESRDKDIYIYGIIQDNQARRWNLPGIGGSEVVYTVCQDSLAAIVSEGTLKLYEATQENLLAHNKVLEEVMNPALSRKGGVKAFWVLPLRLGTVARSEGEVKTFLQKASRPLREAFSQLEGRAEVDVEAEWHGDGIFKLIAEENEKIREHKARIAAAGKAAGLNEQIAMGMMVAEAINQRKAQVSQEIEAGLKTYAERVSPLKARTKDTVFNAAFLVPQERMKPFEEAIYRLGDQYGKLLKFRYAGPLPCYSFVKLQVMLADFQAVDEARKTLELGDSATLAQVKKAYRSLAMQCHPDRNPNDPQARARFEKVAASYRLLLGFWETVGNDPDQAISFTEERIGKTMVVIPHLSDIQDSAFLPCR